MWKGHDIGHFQKRGVGRQRLFLEDVETSRAKMAGFQRLNQRGLDYDASA
jgi:hypothetical protein